MVKMKSTKVTCGLCREVSVIKTNRLEYENDELMSLRHKLKVAQYKYKHLKVCPCRIKTPMKDKIRIFYKGVVKKGCEVR
ncbi:hypothetical protein [Clostridium perfringens]|uniref:hypothetical protein n=1 Tax=Clostridium perfringens TaxID=1502 RepID=UPI001897F729|nr:hypothetical protein [Clostridium perfringens]